jgi:penicillin amidase
LRWSGNDLGDEIRSVYLINKASCWDEFRHALTTFRSLNQNFAYADIEGNIGMQAAGGIPLKKTNGNMIRNGETDEYDWKGYVPFDQLPFSYNPESGYVSSANNKTVDDNYPFYISNDFAMPYRIIRIRQMLGRQEIFNLEDFREMINDQHSELARLSMPLFTNLNNRRAELNQLERNALDTLLKWNSDMNQVMTAPAIFEYFRLSFKKNLLGDELDEIYNRMAFLTGEYYIYKILNSGPDEWVDNIHTPEIEDLDEIIFRSFKDCIQTLGQEYGKNMKNWRWGKIHKIKFIHPMGTNKMLNLFFRLNSGEFSIGGSDHTVSSFYNQNQGFDVAHGVSEKHIFNTASWDESLSVIPGGASGIPGSEFYLSQVRTFVEGKFYKDIYSDDAVRSSKKYTFIFKPEN